METSLVKKKNEAGNIISNFSVPQILYVPYACSGAPTGHVPAHAPHSMHSSAFIQYFVSSSCIAETGQASAHAPHLIQASDI